MNKLERCILGVKAKQSKRCKKSNYKAKGCYNPWAVCNKSVKKKFRNSKKSKKTKKSRKSKKSKKSRK